MVIIVSFGVGALLFGKFVFLFGLGGLVGSFFVLFFSPRRNLPTDGCGSAVL